MKSDKNVWKSISATIRISAVILLVFAIAMVGTASAKSLYVNKDLNSNSPISAYDIQPAPTYLVWQQTSNPTRYGGAGLAIDTNSAILFVTFEFSGTLDIVDATNLSILGQVTAPNATNLAGIVVDQDKQKVYTVERGSNKLYVYSWDSSNVILTLDSTQFLSGVSSAYGIALDEVNGFLYVGDYTTKVKYFNTGNWSQAGNFTVSHKATGIAVDVTKGLVYTGSIASNYLSKYDLSSSSETTLNIGTLSGVSSSESVMGLAVDSDTSLLYTTTGYTSDAILVFNSSLSFLNKTGDIGNPTGIVVPGKDISYNPLNLSKSDDVSDCVSPGGTITYTLSYNNGNINNVTGVTITDTLPAETTFVSCTGGCLQSGNTVTWNIGTVTSGTSGSVTLVVQINPGTPAGSTVTNPATINSNQTPQTTQSETTSICTNQPPTADANGSYTGLEGSPITFDASGSTDPDGDSLTYMWDFDNNGIWDTAWSNSPTATYTWGDDFSGTAKVIVSDGTLTDTATATVTVSNVPPTADAGVDQTALAGDTVSFSGSFTDPGWLDTHTIEWDFGDGNTGTGLNPANTYYDEGVYTVTLTVTDDDSGIGTDTMTVTVNPIPATVDIYPNTLRLRSGGMCCHSRWVTAYIELPEGYDVADINVSTVMLNGTVSANMYPSDIGDYDNDGIADLMVSFDISAVKALFTGPVDAANLTVTGKVLYNGGYADFEGSDTIRVVKRGGMHR